MKHEAKELRYWAALLAPDGQTVLAQSVGAGVTDLSGRRLEQAQLIAAETTHLILMRYADAQAISPQGYIQVDQGNGVVILYIVDYLEDPRIPFPRIWTEIYCHVERTNS